MTEPYWVQEVSVLAMHSKLIERSNGEIPGVISRTLLLSSLDKPRNLFCYGGEVNLFKLAASYAFGLAKNHCFYSANKRITFLVIYTFLKINGYNLIVTKEDTLEKIGALITDSISENDFADWLASVSIPKV